MSDQAPARSRAGLLLGSRGYQRHERLHRGAEPTPVVRVSSELKIAVAPGLIVPATVLLLAYALVGAVILSERTGNGVG